jgi:SagB-type dehydrogenase family enzyme
MPDERELLSSCWHVLEAGYVSAQDKGEPNPPPSIPPGRGEPLLDLPDPAAHAPRGSLADAMGARRSRRRFAGGTLPLGSLSWILWAVQGVQKKAGRGGGSLRTVPSGGARHPFETYLTVRDVEGLEPGLYRLLPFEWRLVRVGPFPGEQVISEACCGQTFVSSAQAVLYWVAIPERTAWRYGPAAPKLIALDAGHACQNLYLACEALGLGTCAIGAYMQDLVDRMLGVDGREALTVYLAPVGLLPGD